MDTANFASAFLSHSSKDEKFVKAVADSLVQRGILAWLDKTQLTLGSLQEKLKEAINKQSIFVIFLSKNSSKSIWCQREIKWVKEKKDADLIIPIYLGEKSELEKLVKKHPQLEEIFIFDDEHGRTLNQLGGVVSGSENLKGNDLTSESDRVALEIAKVVYDKLIPSDWSEVIILLEERGCAPLEGFPSLPSELQNKNAPVLTFRPFIDEVSTQNTLIDGEWQRTSSNMRQALVNALGKLKEQNKTVHISGQAQIGFFWLLGTCFDRTTDVDLYCYRSNLMMGNADQNRISILSGEVSEHTIELIDGSISENQPSIALLIGPKKTYVSAVKNHNQARNIPLFQIATGTLSNSEDAMTLVKDIVIQVQVLADKHNVKEAFIYWTTAAQAAVLTAANLTHHVVPKVNFIEYASNTNDGSGYYHLPMPTLNN